MSQCRGAGDGWLRGICGDRAQLLLRIKRVRTCSRKRRSEALITLRVVSVPLVNLRRCPARVAIGVTAIASVRRAEFYGQIRPGHAQTVIVPWIDDHVGGGRHVAGHTRSAGAGGRVMMVRRRVVFAWQMAGGAEGIALRAQLSAVRVMAVAASNTARVHLALEERAPIVNLAALLSVAVVKGRGEERRTIMVKERFARLVALRDLAAPRMTLRADLDLAIGCARL